MASLIKRGGVDSVSLGVPPQNAEGCTETIIFIVHDFENRYNELELPTYDSMITSPTLSACGCRWRILLFKGSQSGIEIWLKSLTKPVEGTAVLRIHDWKCQKNISYQDPSQLSHLCHCSRYWLCRNAIAEDKSLMIQIDITLDSESPRNQVWYPAKFERQSILVDLYEKAASKTADVAFAVGKNEYRAHKVILALRCKKLYEIAKDYGENVTIPVDDIKEEVFKAILEFTYTVRLPSMTNKDNAKEVLVAADLYECIPLKLYVESVIVDKFVTPENTAEFFLFADSYSCALLRETAIKRFTKDPHTVRKATEWSAIKESKQLILELLEALTGEQDHENDIATLRESCEKENLNVDGSRQVLIERLKKKRKSADVEN